VLCRVVVATHPAPKKKSPVGITRADIVYELFFTNLPQQAFTAVDVVELYLHRGAFEPTLADEDREQDPDRWCSHSACGQEAQAGWWHNGSGISASNWGIPSNPRSYARPSLLLLFHRHRHTRHLPQGMFLQRWAPHGKRVASRATISRSNPTGRSAVQQTKSFVFKSSAGKSMAASAWSTEPASAVVVPAKLARTVPVEWQRHCQATPGECAVASAPGGFCPAADSRDWSRREHRRTCIQLVRHQRIEMSLSPSADTPPTAEVILSRAKREHARLCWQERLARNARPPAVGQVTITLFGVPDAFTTLLSLRAP
jgi:hypothetical protein